MKANLNVIWLIGPFGPPVSGQSLYDEKLLKFLSAHLKVKKIETGSSWLGKVFSAMRLVLAVLYADQRETPYISLPGQLGVWLLLPTIAVLRIRRHHHYIHHHSFRAINCAPCRSHMFLCRLGGPYQRHVFLSPAMRRRYAECYLTSKQVDAARILPNAFLYSDAESGSPTRQGPLVIGHLSVMTRWKGPDYVAKLFLNLHRQGIECALCFAGPIADAALRNEIVLLMEEFPGRVKWLGPVVGGEVLSFYSKVDIFLLPSRLVDEADPLVILEAYRAGCEVMSTGVGCVPERLRTTDATLTLDIEADTSRLAGLVSERMERRYESAVECIAHSKRLYRDALLFAEELFRELGVGL